ncbi:MAG: hypothetical protein KZQ57_00545, partial [gamma proteobacterium symbiont of Lucinoma myriamae]|nr:hypothetical protein [gamma proteobacterium symbiont of Lucinoma myriamae]
WLDTIYIAVILLQGTYTPLVYAHDGRTQLESLYFKTFPDSRRLIDVRSQTENQYKQLKKNSASHSSFLGLLGLVGEELHRNKDFKINSLRYNDGVLQVDISSRVAGEVRSVLNFKTNRF